MRRGRILAAMASAIGMISTLPPATALATTGVSNNGGSVISSPAVYIDFWGPEWGTGFTDSQGHSSITAVNYIESFFTNVGGSAWLNPVTQYSGISNPTGQLRGVWNDPNSVPPNLAYGDVLQEATNAYGWFGDHANLDAVYFVFTAPNHLPAGWSSGMCGYHYFQSAPGVLASFAYVPYPTYCSQLQNRVNSNDSFGHGWLDAYSIVSGHEYAEAITDPTCQTWYQGSNVFNGLFCEVTEVGDLCQNGPWANTVMGGQYFAVQGIWSNGTNSCALQGGACYNWTLYSSNTNYAAFIDKDGSTNYSWYGIDTWVDACQHVYFDSWTQIRGTAWPQWMYSALHVVSDGAVVFDSYNFIGRNAPKLLPISSPVYPAGHNYSYQDTQATYGWNYSWNPAWNPTEPQTSPLVGSYP